MYPSNGYVVGNAAASTAPTQFNVPNAPQVVAGIASHVQELQSSVGSVCETAFQVKCALGIQSPPTETKGAQPPSTLAEVLGDLRYKLNCATAELQDVLQHLNS